MKFTLFRTFKNIVIDLMVQKHRSGKERCIKQINDIEEWQKNQGNSVSWQKKDMSEIYLLNACKLDWEVNLATPLSWHSLSQENTRFYDDTLESERLKTINIKSRKPITYRNCVLSNWMCCDRCHSAIVTISTAVGTRCNFLMVKLAPSPII